MIGQRDGGQVGQTISQHKIIEKLGEGRPQSPIPKLQVYP